MPKDSVLFSQIREEINQIGEKTAERHLDGRVYSAADVQSFTTKISEEVVRELQIFNNNFKYTVVCTIMQKGDSGLHMSSSCFWNTGTDGSLAVRFDNASLVCVINIFALAL